MSRILGHPPLDQKRSRLAICQSRVSGGDVETFKRQQASVAATAPEWGAGLGAPSKQWVPTPRTWRELTQGQVGPLDAPYN